MALGAQHHHGWTLGSVRQLTVRALPRSVAKYPVLQSGWVAADCERARLSRARSALRPDPQTAAFAQARSDLCRYPRLGGRDREVRAPGLALDDIQRHALEHHPDRMRVTIWCGARRRRAPRIATGAAALAYACRRQRLSAGCARQWRGTAAPWAAGDGGAMGAAVPGLLGYCRPDGAGCPTGQRCRVLSAAGTIADVYAAP